MLRPAVQAHHASLHVYVRLSGAKLARTESRISSVQMSLKDLAESCSMLGGACGSILGWHEKPALAVGKVKAMGVTHSQSHNLGICMWRVRLSQQESNPSTV